MLVENNMRKWFHLSIDKIPNWFGLLSTLIFVLFIIIVLPQQSNLASSYGLKESIDTSWFYNAKELYRIAESYGISGRQFYIYQRWTFDLIWPFVYFSFIFSLSALLYKSIGLSKINRWILSFIWLGIGFDFLENTMVTLVMLRYPALTWIIADFAGTATSLKWIFIGLGFLVLILLTILKIIQIGLRITRK
jgi:hypothetical protein